MLRKLIKLGFLPVALSLTLLIALIFAAIPAFAGDSESSPPTEPTPTTTVTVTATTSSELDGTINLNGNPVNANVNINGESSTVNVNTSGSTINADNSNINTDGGTVNATNSKVTANGYDVVNTQMLGSALSNASNANGWWQNSVAAQLYDHQKQLTTVENHVVMDEAALSKLISQSQASDEDIIALQESSQNLYQDIDSLTGQLNDLNDRLVAANTNATEQIYALQQKNNALEQESNALEQELASLNGKISDLQQAQYLQEHSGFVYNVKTFFGNLFNGVKNYVCQIRAN